MKGKKRFSSSSIQEYIILAYKIKQLITEGITAQWSRTACASVAFDTSASFAVLCKAAMWALMPYAIQI